MSQFKIDDLVFVNENPKGEHLNSHINMKGMRGFIQEIKDDYAQFQQLREDGLGGCGAVPLVNLSLASDDAALQSLKLARDEKLVRLKKECDEMSKRFINKYEDAVVKASELTGVSKHYVRVIFEQHQMLIDNLDRNYGW